MVGNDIVDLRDPDSDPGSYSPRFDERVFTPTERRAIAAAADPATCRWRYWAAKEAAYKALVKVDADAVFSPLRLEVAVWEERPRMARVTDRAAAAGLGSLEVRFFAEGPALHAVALHPVWNLSYLVHGLGRVQEQAEIARDPDAPGRSARRLACERIARVLGIAAEDLEVRKEGRVPVLFAKGSRAPGNLSLSHHGSFTGFAFEWEPSQRGFAA